MSVHLNKMIGKSVNLLKFALAIGKRTQHCTAACGSKIDRKETFFHWLNSICNVAKIHFLR